MAEKKVVDGEISDATDVVDVTGLVAVVKDGETIHVNPLVLKEHQNLGWKVVA